MKKGFLALGLLLGGMTFSSCTDDIMGSKPVDEGAYDTVTRIEGMLLDAKSNKNESVVELRGKTVETEVFFKLTKVPNMGVDVQVEVDPSYLETFNKEHDTDFEMYPVENVKIANEGKLLLAPDEIRSANIGVTLTANDKMQADKTYLLPLTVTTSTQGVTLSEKAQRAVYMVKDLRSQSDTYKGPDAVKTVLYFEVNDTNPLNALEFVLKDSGKLFFDEVVLFSANINYNPETGRVYVFNNPNVQFLLDNNEKFLQPLRKRGIKVILGILGNHDAAGVAQLSDMGAREFAKELAAYCKAYNLDGVGFDDEYSDFPDLTNPWFARRSGEAASRLLYETKRAMPDKTVMVYYLGRIYEDTIVSVDGVLPGEFVDYAVADYGGTARPMNGMTRKQCSGMSIELNRGTGNTSEDFARSKRKEGYGYYMFFALGHTNSLVNNFGSYRSQVLRCQMVCRGLYEDELLMPEYYYKKNDATRYKLPN